MDVVNMMKAVSEMKMRKMMKLLLMAALVLIALFPVSSGVSSLYGAMQAEAAEKELLTNPGFEIQEPGSMAPGWQGFQGSFGKQLVFENHPVYEGDWSFAIYDTSSKDGFGLRSMWFPASPGQEYVASVMAMAEQNCLAYLYLDFADANGNRIKDRVVYTDSSDWQELTVTMLAPEGTAWVSIILYTKVDITGIARYDNASLILIYDDTGMGVDMDMTADAKPLDYSPVAAAKNELLTNPGFEMQEPGSMAPGWQVFQGSFGKQLVFENHPVYEGDWSFAIHDTSPNNGYGLRSVLLPASPGQEYEASVMAMTEQGGLAYLHLEFLDADEKRIKNRSVFTPSPDWQELKVTMEAPEGTAWVSIILYSKVNITGIARYDNASLTLISEDTWTGGSVDLKADADTLDYSPADGAVVTTNPPSFVWIPVTGAQSYILEYTTDPEFTPSHTVTVPDIDISIYTPAELLDNTKTWYWRVRAVDRRGNSSPPSVARAFKIDVHAVSLPLPPLSEVRAQIPTSHPRLFVRPENLAEWRQKPNSGDLLYEVLWNSLKTKAFNALYEGLPAEPAHCQPHGVLDVNLWREYSITVNATETMELLAFAYMMTGDKDFGKAARRWMLHLASWDPSPNGATSAAVNDESSMPILLQMSRAYTWAYDALTPEDREVIRNVMRIRGNEAYQILREELKYESRPYRSHAGRSLGFLGEAAIAFMGEIPEAQEWFDYIVRIFYAIYPAWGKDPGGWAEGHSYWTSYMNRVTWFVDALREATGLDLFQKAFFKNTGTFKLYTQPPYSKMGPFGDLSDRGPTPDAGVVMNLFAAVYNNPYYKWYAEKMGFTAELRVMGYIRAILHDSRGISSKAPIDLPPSTYFPDIGWAVFHKQMGGEANDSIQFMFKSSPYGSFSHSFADQNTFTLEAYGEPLAISSGYRPWYASQHHRYWTKTTQAHNGVLVDGKGQQEQSLAAKGRIIGFLNGESFDYTAGEAHTAYGPARLELYLRHVVYIRPDIFVLYDDLKAPKASTYSWLLHSYHQMSIEEEGQMGHIRLEAEKAYLDTYLWADSPLSYSQTNQFAVPLDEPMDKPEQWHLMATTKDAKPEGSFLAVLSPGKKDAAGKEQEQAGQPKFLVEKVAAGEAGEGVRLQIFGAEEGAAGAAAGPEEALVLFRRGEAPGVLEVGEDRSDAVVAAWRERGDDTYGLLVADGTFWHSGFGYNLDSEALISAELTFSRTCINGTILHPDVLGSKPYEVALRLPDGKGAAVKSVSSSHQLLDWSLAGDTLLLILAPGEHKLTVSMDVN